VLDKIFGQLIEAITGGNYLVVLAEQLLQERGLIRVEFGLLYFGGDPCGGSGFLDSGIS
jgi:hypothetical protein